jgi:hypothetical protein
MAEQEYVVEVQRTVMTEVRIRAASPESAARAVNRASFPLPPLERWNVLSGWLYLVSDPVSGERLYEGDGC